MTVGLVLFVLGVRRGSGRRGRRGGAIVVVVVLPFLQPLGEQAGVVDDLAFQQPAELFGVDAVRTLYFAVQPRVRGLM